MPFTLRITQEAPDHDTILKDLTAVYVCENYGKDGEDVATHWHYAVKDDCQAQKIKKRLSKLGIKGNAMYSLKKWDLTDTDDALGYLRYLCKGRNKLDFPVIYGDMSQFTDKTVFQLHNDYWHYNENQYKVKKKSKQSKSLLEMVVAKCRKVSKNLLDENCVIETIYAVCKEHGMLLPNKFLVPRYVHTVLMLLDCKGHEAAWCNQMKEVC